MHPLLGSQNTARLQGPAVQVSHDISLRLVEMEERSDGWSINRKTARARTQDTKSETDTNRAPGGPSGSDLRCRASPFVEEMCKNSLNALSLIIV